MHRPMVVAVARQRGAGADAEDVAQEALLRAYTRTGIDLDRAGPYLARIANNLIVDSHRRATRERLLRSHAGMAPPPVTPTEQIEDQDLARHARQLVGELAPDVQVMVAQRGAGASWPQIASDTGRRWETLAVRYHRAISRVRQQLSDDGGGMTR